MMELVTVRDGSRTVYVEKNLIKQVVIHPQIQQVPGAPAHICGFILGLRDGTMMGVTGEPGTEESGEPGEMAEAMPGIWEKKCDTIE